VTALTVVVAALAFLSAVGVVGFSQTIYSALSLIANMVCLSVLFLLLNAQFLAAVQVIIYAGAVMVLFVFIIALLNPGAEDRPDRSSLRYGLGVVAIAYVVVQFYILATNGTTFNKDTHVLRGQTLALRANPHDPGFQFTTDAVNAAGNVQTTGGQLFTTFLLPFEITSLLLLVAAVGAVYLTRRTPQDRGA
jgi:NADH-quinone oxidoreductase subunit J